MKKLIFTLAILLSYSCLSAQETAINLNEDYLFYQGKTLFEQRNFAASTQYFEKFLEATTNKNNSLSQEAAYYVACNAYELKQKNPGKKFYSVGHRQYCPNMKKITLEKIAKALDTMKPEVEIKEEKRLAANAPLIRMLELAK